MSQAVVYTDGACRNQGLANAKAGWGVFWGDNHSNNRYGWINGLQDSNRAELAAAKNAISMAVENGYRGITINSDSQYVKEAVDNSAFYQQSPVEKRDLQQSIHDMKRRIDVNVQLIAAHSGIHGNNKAHEFANMGVDNAPPQ